MMAALESVLNIPSASSQNREGANRRRAVRDWQLCVERGPNWLFVRIKGGVVKVSDMPPLALVLRSLLEQNLTYRIVLELDRVLIPSGYMVRQLEQRGHWSRDRNGVLRLCGLRARYAKALRRHGLGVHWACYRDRKEAVFGSRRF